ncbi:MAG: hypothetical protein IJU31_05700 [Synergistaceae bacterium]|nr:hypothetical protein [Synergistaceae bacterium]
MLKKDLLDFISKVFKSEGKSFTTVRHLAAMMPLDMKRELGLMGLHSSVDVKRVIEPLLDDKYIFNKKGQVLYIIEPCKPENLIIGELSKIKGKSPKAIGRVMPFTKRECARLLMELVEQKRIRIMINEALEPRIFLPDNKLKAEEIADDLQEKGTIYTLEKLRNAFKSLDNGRIFVRICDLRKKLNWPRDIFDTTLIKLRDAGMIQLHVGDASLMTTDEIKNCFVDENNFRMGTVTWNGK